MITAKSQGEGRRIGAKSREPTRQNKELSILELRFSIPSAAPRVVPNCGRKSQIPPPYPSACNPWHKRAETFASEAEKARIVAV